ncbi:class I SAM-dependent methyltransferase [Chloroflexota bacterium]
MLHLGCEDGHSDFTLKNHFSITGIDVSLAMLELARQLNPEVDYCLDDMRTVNLDKTFDSVIIGDSISYMLTRDNLSAVFRTAFIGHSPLTFVAPAIFYRDRVFLRLTLTG